MRRRILRTVWRDIFTGSSEASVSTRDPAGGHAAASQAAFAPVAIPGLSTVVICTPSGFETIEIGQKDEAPAGEFGHPGCEWCQSFGSAPELAPPADGSAILRDHKTVQFQTQAAATLARHGVLTGFDSRAPPL